MRGAVLVAYLPPFLVLPSIAPEIAWQLLKGERLFVLAVYTAVSYSLPIALIAALVLEKLRSVSTPRLRLALVLICAFNWLPLSATLIPWGIKTDGALVD